MTTVDTGVIPRLPVAMRDGRRWMFLLEDDFSEPAAAVERDLHLFNACRTGAFDALCRVWVNSRCLVVSGSDRNYPDFDRARQILAQSGIPIVRRSTGGTAVLHGPGVINLSLIYRRCGSVSSIDRSYGFLCDWVAHALRNLGLTVEAGAVKGAFCDGRYNLIANGQKIAGTAQKIGLTPDRQQTVYLSHMSLLVDVDVPSYVDLIQSFYDLSGRPQALTTTSVSCVAELLPRQPRENLSERIINSLMQSD